MQVAEYIINLVLASGQFATHSVDKWLEDCGAFIGHHTAVVGFSTYVHVF